MKIKLNSPRMELAALRGMTHKDKIVHSTFLASVGADHFSSDVAKEVLAHIKTQFQDEGKPPTFRVLVEDPSLSKDARQWLKESPGGISNRQEAKQILKNLDKYRQIRAVTDILYETQEQLQSRKVDLKSIRENLTQGLARLAGNRSNDHLITRFGKDSNARDLYEDVIYGDKQEDVIPTGLLTFDEVNGGVIRGSLFTIGGNSGAGKSQLASSLAVNMASRGYVVVLVPLEMSEKEMAGRIIANVTKLDSRRIILGKLTENEKDYAFKKMRQWEKRCAKRGGSYVIYKPDTDVTIQDVYAVVDAMNPDVCIIDYVTLLAEDSNTDQWKQLGHVARIGKINAENNNRVNILLCQVNDDGTIRYSRAINEHSSLSWVFVANAETKEQGILPIEQTKARNQDQFPFTLGINYAESRVYDLKEGGRNEYKVREPDLGGVQNLAAESDI